MRRLLTIVIVATLTATGSLYWLHDGDLAEAVQPLTEAEWDAELLVRNAGLEPAAPEEAAPEAE